MINIKDPVTHRSSCRFWRQEGMMLQPRQAKVTNLQKAQMSSCYIWLWKKEGTL